MLVENLGPNGLEIECKLVTVDMGRKIHRKDSASFLGRIRAALEPATRNINNGLAIVVTLPDRLPDAEDQLHELVRFVCCGVLAGKNIFHHDGTGVRVLDFTVTGLGNLENPLSRQNRDAIDRITGTRNRECFIEKTRDGGLLVVVVQSVQPDTVMKNMISTVARAAEKQFTRSRPGILALGLEDISSESLAVIGVDDNSGARPLSPLHSATVEYLRSESPDHLIGIVYMSAPVTQKSNIEIESRGTTYYFPKRSSPMWHNDFSGIFGLG